jgi:hypothetical protein
MGITFLAYTVQKRNLLNHDEVQIPGKNCKLQEKGEEAVMEYPVILSV